MTQFIVLLCRESLVPATSHANQQVSKFITEHWACGPFEHVDEAKEYIKTLPDPMQPRARIVYLDAVLA